MIECLAGIFTYDGGTGYVWSAVFLFWAVLDAAHLVRIAQGHAGPVEVKP